MAAESQGRSRTGKRKVQEKADGTKFVTIPLEIVESRSIERGDVIDWQDTGDDPIEAYHEPVDG